MDQLNGYFQQADLALAAYASLSAGEPSQAELIKVGMSPTQAQHFSENWRVVDQFTSSGVTGTGFSATVFEEVSGPNAGKRYLAIRGTEPSGLLDFIADADLALFNGVAARQTVDLYNYYQRLIAQKGQPVVQLEWTGQSYVLSTSGGATGLLDMPLAGPITVTGHSLGGHLAMAFGRLFPGATGEILTYNAPGFQDAPADTFFERIDTALGRSGSSFRDILTTNLYGSGLSIIAGFADDHGTPQQIFLETNTHDIVDLTDALALYGLFAKIDPALNTTDPAVGIGKITDILKAVSSTPVLSLEASLDSLRTLFSDPAAPAPAPTASDNREQFYQNLYATDFQNRISAYTGLLSVVPLTDKNALTIEANAFSDIAYRYALKALNAFAILGEAGIYDQFNQGGELDVYDPATRAGTLTADWIADRSNLLFAQLIRNTQDNPDIARIPGSSDISTEYHHYRDGKEEVFFADPLEPVGSLPLKTQVVEFADDAGRSLIGTDFVLGDRLYGGGGTDYLEGKTGQDYLEGGRGLDLYTYNSTRNLGAFGATFTGDGADTVRDVDGKGVLRLVRTEKTLGSITSVLGSVIADASVKFSDNNWQSADGRFGYVKAGGDLVVTINGDGGGTITLKDFRDGDFGIRLWEARTAPEFAATGNTVSGGNDEVNSLTGTVAADLIQAFGGDDTVNGGAGDDIVEGGAGNDILDGQAGNDRVYGEAGDDEVTGGLGDDEVRGGDGRDFVSDAGGANLLEGNVGSDIVYAFGAGRDELYADTQVALSTAILAGELAGTGLKGDWLMAGADDDLVVGAAGDDVLMGGGGADILVGGAGDDNIEGDLGYVTTTFDWNAARNVIPQPDGSILYQLVYDPAVTVDESTGGNDVIYAGGGEDWVRAGVGDDFVDAGSGSDKVWGEAGSDVLMGGDGDDLLVGDNPGFVTGADEGGDYLDGGAGDDQLFGNGGADILIGGAGNDILVGGAGKDIYVFNRGDGTETVFDTPAGANDPEASILILGEGANRSDIRFRTGSLMVDFGGGDAIHFEGFDQLNPANTPLIGEIRFADGTSMSYEDILAQGFDIDGTEGSDDNHDATHPQLVGTGVTDRIRGLGGDDIIAGIGGDDTLDGGAGNDLIVGGAGNDVLMGGAGFDQLQGGSGNDNLQGGDDNDQLFGDADDATEMTFGDDVLDGGAGDDFLFGNAGNDTLYGGEGADNLQGQAGSDVLEGGAGNDFLYGDGIYEFQGGFFVNLFDDGAADILRGGDGDDQLDAGAGDDMLDGGAGADTLFAGAGNDWLSGGDGNDQLVGGGGDDQLGGGSGDDTLFGEAGNDTYLFNLGDGRDLVIEDLAIDIEVLRFGAGIVSGDLTFSRTAGDLVISCANGTDAVTIANWYGGTGFQMTRLELADGSVLSGTDAGNRGLQLQRGTEGNDTLAGTTGNDTLFGLGGNDTIFGNGGSDTLIGGAGNDTLNASSGNDSFHFAPGDGADTITDTGGSDALIFGTGITKAEITPSRAGGDLVLTRTASSDTVTIRGWFNSFSNKIESITFAGTGEAFTGAELTDPFLTLNGTAANDVLEGGIYAETFNALGGNDLIFAGGGDDFLAGGTGNDNLFGDAGFDTFRFFAGDGQDTVNDSDGRGVVHFGPGLVDQVVFTLVSGGRQVTFTGSTDSVLIKDPTISTFNNVQTKFDILGTEGNDTITGSSFNDVIQGLGGADAINGGNGADEIFGGTGNDILEGGGSDTDFSRDSLFGGDGDDILDSGLRTGTGDVGGALTGGPGNDQLFGSSGTDFYFFNLGDGQDIINDESLFANGHTIFSTEDAIIFGPGITQDTIGARFSGADVIIQVTPTDSVTMKNWTNLSTRVDFLRFADGTSMDDAAIQELALTLTGTAGNDTLTGTAQADTIRGLGGDDTIFGLGGDDKLTGGTGNDVIDGGTGNDSYFFNAGDGEDQIIDASGTDTLQFGAGISASDVTLGRSVNSLVLTLADGTGSITIDDYLSDPVRRIETFQFPDGSTLPDATTIVDTLVNIRGTSGDDTLVGTPGFDILTGFEGNDSLSGLGDDDLLFGGTGADILSGGPGADTMDGGSGADTYLFDLGDGADIIIDPDTGGRIQFGAGISPQGVAATRSGNALTLSITGTTDQLSVPDYFVNFQIGEFGFDDGAAWDVQTIKNFVLTGTAGDDTLAGFDSDDVIQGLGGNDQLFGGAGNDTIDGGTGSDFLSGDDGDDVLVAGNGDNARAGVVNTLDGGTGNDVLIAGDTSSNQMSGDSGLDIYIGGAGSDQMSDTFGRSLFYAKDGTDQLTGSDDNDLYIGGTDNDAIDGDSNGNGLSGSDIVLFNSTDGKDTVVRLGQATALSLGGMTSYSQLKFDRNGTALSVKVGHNSITFNDWYDTTAPGSRVANLQIMAETLRRFDPASTDPLFNQKVQIFDFLGLVAAWDRAQANRQRFVVADHLAEFRLSGSDTQAFGGEVAYQYGTTGMLDAFSFAQMQAVINAPEFGAQPQAIGAGASPAAITAFASTSDAADPGTETLAPTTTSILTDSTMIDLFAGDTISTDSTVQTIATGDFSFASSAPTDTLQQNLQARIDNWFDEAQYRQAYGLSAFYQSSAYADGARFLEAGDPAANAAQWDRIARGLPLHLAQYADGGLDLHEGAFSGVFGSSFFGGGTPIVNAVGLPAVASNSLKGFQGLQEGLTRLA